MTAPDADVPTITVVRGDPTAEELAALVTVLLSRRDQTGSSPSASPGGEWSAYWRGLRTPPAPGPGVWRRSARS